MTTSTIPEAPEQLTLLTEPAVPLRFRLDEATRRRGLRHIAEIRAQLERQPASRPHGHAPAATARGAPGGLIRSLAGRALPPARSKLARFARADRPALGEDKATSRQTTRRIERRTAGRVERRSWRRCAWDGRTQVPHQRPRAARASGHTLAGATGGSSSHLGYGLGIDVGTTFTAAALIPGRQRRGGAPGDAPGRRAVGDLRRRRRDAVRITGGAPGAVQPLGLAREFKRRLGDPVPLMLSGSPYHADRLTALM